MENVDAILHKANYPHFQKFIIRLNELGYTSSFAVLNAKDFGVPQNRKRCFMVSTLHKGTFKFPTGWPLELRLKDMLEDNVNYEDKVIKGIDILNEAGMDVRHKATFYVYCSGDDHYEDALHRCRVLKEHGATAYLMVNPEGKITRRVKELKRWTRPWLFWSIDIEQYNRGVA